MEKDIIRLDEEDADVAGDPEGDASRDEEDAEGEGEGEDDFTEDYDSSYAGSQFGGYQQVQGGMLGLEALEDYLRMVTGAMGGSLFGMAGGDSDSSDDDAGEVRFQDGTLVRDQYPEADHDMRLEEMD